MEGYPSDTLRQDLSKKRVSAPIPPPRLSSKSFSLDETKTEKSTTLTKQNQAPKIAVTIPEDGKKRNRSPLNAFMDLGRRASRSPIRERFGFGSSGNRQHTPARKSRFVEEFDFEPRNEEVGTKASTENDEKVRSEENARALGTGTLGSVYKGNTIKMVK